MKKHHSSLILKGGILALALVAADQITKYLAHAILSEVREIPVIPGVFELYYLENQGAAFGMFSGRFLFFVLIALIMIAAASYLYVRLPDSAHYHPLRAVCILIAAGAAGNMIDRIARGYVVDFLYVSLINFPVFNIADCYVCIGAALAVVLIFTVYRSEEFAFLKRHS